MHAGIALSVIVHAAIILCGTFVPLGTRIYEPAGEPPVAVDLVTPEEAAPAPEQPPERPPTHSEALPVPKPAAQPPTPQVETAVHPAPAPRRAPDKPSPTVANPTTQIPPVSPENTPEPPLAADWYRHVLDFQKAPVFALPEAPPGESNPDIPRNTVADLKKQIMKCWAPPPGIAGTSGLKVVIRVALSPSGAITGEPVLIQATASSAGPAVVKSAMQAIKKCQPYNSLPAASYKEWKTLDLSFTSEGISGA